MGDLKGCATHHRWSAQGGAGGTPNPAPPPSPSRREVVVEHGGNLLPGGVAQNAISPADVRAGVARELRALAADGRHGSEALRDAIAITAAKIRNAPALVERQAHPGRCHACGEPLDDAHPVVAVMQAKGGGSLWLHHGECCDEHSQRRAALVDRIMAAAGYGVEAKGEAA